MEQKQQLNKRLGLEMCNTLKISPTDAFVTEEDFMVEEATETPAQVTMKVVLGMMMMMMMMMEVRSLMIMIAAVIYA